MADNESSVPLGPNIDLNTFLNKYKDDTFSHEDQPNIFNITSIHILNTRSYISIFKACLQNLTS